METPQLNEHNKAEYPPMHTGEFDASQIQFQFSQRIYTCVSDSRNISKR